MNIKWKITKFCDTAKRPFILMDYSCFRWNGPNLALPNLDHLKHTPLDVNSLPSPQLTQIMMLNSASSRMAPKLERKKVPKKHLHRWAHGNPTCHNDAALRPPHGGHDFLRQQGLAKLGATDRSALDASFLEHPSDPEEPCLLRILRHLPPRPFFRFAYYSVWTHTRWPPTIPNK